jgi:hypothetical protein
MVDRKGYLEDFFDIYASEHTKAIVLSFSDIEDMYKITYIPCQAVVWHTSRVCTWEDGEEKGLESSHR